MAFIPVPTSASLDVNTGSGDISTGIDTKDNITFGQTGSQAASRAQQKTINLSIIAGVSLVAFFVYVRYVR